MSDRKRTLSVAASNISWIELESNTYIPEFAVFCISYRTYQRMELNVV